jgi:ribosome biogenesis GTPase / thiamine phosphate phosphatase
MARGMNEAMPPDPEEPAASPGMGVLADLGWGPFFAQQLAADDLQTSLVARVMAVHRSGLQVAGIGLDTQVSHFADGDGGDAGFATVGDWLLLHPDTLRPKRLLRRTSLIKRRAAGTGRGLQLIAANIDTLFIVTSCNQDFNVARLERYLALAGEAGVTPVVVITKSDLADEPDAFAEAAARLLPGLDAVVLDARNPQATARLSPWCGRGRTVAFVGSSGVGKSTLINTMTRTGRIATRGIREDDAKGRHTTTARQLHRLPSGGWLLDTPGMRELQLTDVQHGLDDVFADIAELAQSCRFRDCRHDTEPGCAVRAAVDRGELDESRLHRWTKLTVEDAFNTQSLAERRARDRAFGKMVKSAKKDLRD